MSGLPHKESFYVRLPSNVITTEHENTAWDYLVPLPYPLNFTELDEWTVTVTSVFLPPLGKQNAFDNVFIYSNLVTGTLVGDVETPLLCTVDMKAGLAEGVTLGGVLREPEQLMYCPLRVGYIESIRLILRNEFGSTLTVFDRGQTVVVLHFLKKRLPMGERRLVLPSNASKELYPDNTGHTFSVRLPASLNYVPDDWEVTGSLDNSRWTKIWMEEDQNTVVLKRWTLDANLYVMMSLELVDYFGFPKNKNDAKLGFKAQPGPPFFTKLDKTKLTWQGDPPMIWSGPTWTLPDTGRA
ncbi:hypothetical protein QZH41_015087 [Actinostola sp. cb2023]|nr:hypothetical protein QZH41_015087 [Actinostola sp. cb2023]